MERGSDDTQQPSLCRMGCGFYGSSSSDGMCSKCFKDALRRKQSSPTTSATAAVMSSSSTGWYRKRKIFLTSSRALALKYPVGVVLVIRFFKGSLIVKTII